MMFEYAEEIERLADIKVVGVGGAGGNAVGRMIEAGLTGVEFLAVNTDLQALKESPAHHAMQIGAQLTKGLGSGGLPATGQAAAEEDRETLAAALQGADMVFVTAGMGGGTGTGAAPIIAEIARGQGALTVGIVTKPFLFEGKVRLQQALEGLERLRESVDTLIVIPNQRLLEVVPPSTSMQEAFRIADNVLYEATRGIFEIISRHDHVNLDFADVRSVMTGMGEAMMGTGRAEGDNRAVEAARAAISSPLLEDVDIAGSRAVLVNVLGKEVGLQDTAAAMEFIQNAAGSQAHVIFGYGQDDTLGDTLQITVIATGFQGCEQSMPEFAAARVATETVDFEPEATEASTDSEEEAYPEIPLDSEAETAEETPMEFAEVPAEEPCEEHSEQLPEERLEVSADVSPEYSFHQTEEWAEDIPASEDLPVEAVRSVEQAQDELNPAARVEWSADSNPDEATDLGFLTRAAAAGEVVESAPESTHDERTASSESAHPFLRPAGRRLIGEVEVPERRSDPEPVNRSTASGLGPDHLAGDLSTPAYTRKYMD